MWLPLIRASHIPAPRIDITRTERQKNERSREKKETVLQSKDRLDGAKQRNLEKRIDL